MGCFNVSCGVSGISMYTDAMVLVPLIPARFPIPLTSAHLVGCMEVGALFQPFCLPLFGYHDTYGRLEYIAHDWHAEAIEAAYHVPIAQFAEHFTTFHKENKHPILPADACGMYVHRQIWDVFSQPTFDEYGIQQQPCENKDPDLAERAWWLDPQSYRYWRHIYGNYETHTVYQDLLWALRTLLENMYALNKILMPTMNGFQHGNYYAERLLHETALGIINQYIAENGE